MNKRNKLQVHGPESSFSTFKSDSLVLNPKISSLNHYFTQEEKRIIKKSAVRMVVNILYGKFKAFYRFIRGKYGLIVAIFFLFIYMIWHLIDGPKITEEDIHFLIKENRALIEENKLLKAKRSISIIKNICQIEFGTEIVILSKPYKFGFLKLKQADPNSALYGNSECFAISGGCGAFVIKLKNKHELIKFGIYHPPTGNRKSAIKEFKLIFDDKSIIFNFGGKGYEEFDIRNTSDSLKVEIISNHGEQKYTCVYQIFLFSIFNQ